MRTAWSRSTRFVLSLFSVSIVLADSHLASADGFFVWRNEHADIFEPLQKAMIVFDEGWEELVLEVRYEGPVEDFGWIVPLPAVPQITKDTPEVFEQLSRITQDPVLGRWYRPETRGLGAIEVIENKRVGIYDTAVLRGESGAALEGWLDAHDYRLPEGAALVLADYASRDWVFAAFRVAPVEVDSATAQALRQGTIQPLRFRFATSQAVYPLRISSLLQGETEVLLYVLAREWTTPSNLRALPWEEQYGGHPKYLDWYLDPEVWPGLAADGCFVTKLRAKLSSPQMTEDLALRPRDVTVDLRDGSVLRRARAATYLGLRREREAVPRLLNLLDPGVPLTEDVLTTLWALGKIGDPRAESTLLAWADHDTAEARVEALGSLITMDSSQVSSILLRALTRSSSTRHEEFLVDEERKMAHERLVSTPHAELVPDLRRIADEYDAWSLLQNPRWNFGLGYEDTTTIRSYLLAALTAAEDPRARNIVLRALVDGSAVCNDSLLMCRGGGYANDFPMAFRPAEMIYHDDEYFSGWVGYEFVRQAVAKNPDVQDELFRRALATSLLPDAAEVVLIAFLHDVSPAELDSLRSIGRASLGPRKLMKTVELRPRYERKPPTADYNVLAGAVAHALGRQKDVVGLLELWEECPPEDHVLRGEIALAATRSKEPRAVDLVVDYVRDAWNRACERTDFPVATDTTDVRAFYRKAFRWDEHLDFRYRRMTIQSYLCKYAPDRLVEEIILDRSQHRLHRMYWMRVGPSWLHESKDAVARMKKELDLISQDHPDDEATQSAVWVTRRHIEHRVQLRRRLRKEHPSRSW